MSEEQKVKDLINVESETRLLFQLLKCSHFIEREANNILHGFGLKQQQFAVLNEIIWNGPVSQKELVDNLLFEKSNTSRIVKMLSEREYIQVTVSAIDRRLTLLVETPKGFKKWSECLHAINRVSAEFLSTLSKKQTGRTIRRLKQLERSLDVKRKNST